MEYTYIPSPHATTTMQCKLHECKWSIHIYHHHMQPPPCSASCMSASGVCAPVARHKNTTSASCSGCRPTCVQVEYLHQLMEGITMHQCKVQRSGPAPGQVGAGCSNSSCNCNHHAPLTRSGPARMPLECLLQHEMQLA